MNITLNRANEVPAAFQIDVKDLKFQYIQKVEYTKNFNSKTIAYNYGSLSDKWVSEITIQDTISKMRTYSNYFDNEIDQITIFCEEAEQIFGAGIDYSDAIRCNVLNSEISYSQNDVALSTIKLKIEAVKYFTSGDQLKYKSSIPSGLPTKLNFQTPVDRVISKRESAYQSQAFGAFGKISEIDGFFVSNNYGFKLIFDQTEAENAQIEKFVSTQRSTPFILSEADFLYIFPSQDTENVMITGMASTRVSHNNWRTTLTMVNNV